MRHFHEPRTIEVRAAGTADTVFRSTSFRASVNTKGATGPEAKDKAKERVDLIWGVVRDFSERAGVDKDHIRTTFSVDADHQHTGSEYKFVGYKAMYTMSFTAKNVSEATALHDAITSIVGVESPTPVFNVDESIEVHHKAFSDAFDKAKKMFSNQCASAGLSADSYEVVSWDIDEERQVSGKTLSASNSHQALSGVSMEPGKASFGLTVSFQYALKGEPAV